MLRFTKLELEDNRFSDEKNLKSVPFIDCLEKSSVFRWEGTCGGVENIELLPWISMLAEGLFEWNTALLTVSKSLLLPFLLFFVSSWLC
jgi:hypothetical protein